MSSCVSGVGAALEFAQLEALDLSGRRLRQLVDELDEARVLVGRKPFLDEGLETRFVDPLAGLEDDERLGLDEAFLVLLADDRALEYRLVLHQRGLHLE